MNGTLICYLSAYRCLSTEKWRHNERDGISNHRRLACFLRRRSKKASELRVTENPPVTGGFPSQRASNAEYVFVWWRHHDTYFLRSLSEFQWSRATYIDQMMPITAADVISPNLSPLRLSLRWRHNGRDGVSNHHCFLNRLFGRRSKKTSKFRITGHCVGNSPGTGEFPAQMASNAENVSIWWRHYVYMQIPLPAGVRVSVCYCSALPISPGHVSRNNLRKTPIAPLWGRGMGVFCEFEVWPKFYLRSCCAVCNNVLYCSAIYRKSIWNAVWWWRRPGRYIYQIRFIQFIGVNVFFQHVLFAFKTRSIHRIKGSICHIWIRAPCHTWIRAWTTYRMIFVRSKSDLYLFRVLPYIVCFVDIPI